MNDPSKIKMVPLNVFREEAEKLGIIIKKEDIRAILDQFANHT